MPVRRAALLKRIERLIGPPMIVLALVWVGLLVYELAAGQSALIDRISTGLWGLFVADFGFRFVIAPHKRRFLARNWLLALALILPGFRMLAALRFFRVARALPLLRLTAAFNRGARALGRTLGRSGAPYVLTLTLVVAFAGAAGMYATEGHATARHAGFANYGDALWWTAMLVLTIGSAYWPHTMQGRVLALALAIYGFTMLGYVTGIFAKFLVHEKPGADSLSAELAALRREIEALRIGSQRPAA